MYAMYRPSREMEEGKFDYTGIFQQLSLCCRCHRRFDWFLLAGLVREHGERPDIKAISGCSHEFPGRHALFLARRQMAGLCQQ